MGVVWVAVLIMAASVRAAPAIKYDQRQEGDINIRADLENFVILIIPTSTTGSIGLLDLLSKTLPAKAQIKHNRHNNEHKKPQQAIIPGDEETSQHFIESKHAPYHVDISRTRSHLAKLHPNLPTSTNGEVLIAHSPTIALAKNNKENTVLKSDESPEVQLHARSDRSFKFEDPLEDFQALVVSSDLIVGGRKSGRAQKKSEKLKNSTNEDNFALLGADNEQCGPNRKRDSQGICQPVK